jgi:hypothetical protein
MTRRRWGTYHLVRPNWPGEIDDEGRVVGIFRYGPSSLELASELWRLAGHNERADRIKQVTEPAYAREDQALHRAEIEDLLRLLDMDALEDALKQMGLVDANLQISPEYLPELRQRTKLIDIDENRGDLAVYGLSESVPWVYGLFAFLKRALDEGLHVALD